MRRIKEKSKRKSKINDKIQSTFSKDIKMDVSSTRKNQRQNFLILAIVSTMASISCVLSFFGGFNIETASIILAPIILLYSVAIQWTMYKKKYIKIGIPVCLIFSVVFIVIFISNISNGSLGIVNSILDTVNNNMSEAHIKYVVNQNTVANDIVYASILWSLVVTIALNVCIRFKRIFISSILIFVFTLVNIVYKGESQTIYIVLALVSVFLIIYLSNIRVVKSKKPTKFATFVAIFVVLVSVLFVVFVNYTSIRSVDDLKEEVQYIAGNIVYGKSDFPEGKFKRFHKLETGDEEPRLVIEETVPIDLHLRGYVGCQYTEDGWADNDANMYAGKYQGSMEWYRQNDYYPLINAGLYMSKSIEHGMDMKKFDMASVMVNNQTASTKYEYIPENIIGMEGLITPKQDVNFIEQDPFGEDQYIFNVLNFKNDYLKFPSQSWTRTDAKEKKYVEAVNVYHAFAVDTYLNIPEEEKQYLQETIPGNIDNISEAISTVRRFLRENIEYSQEVKPYIPGNNFLKQVLEQDKMGYSVHFSTIATLMFRQYDIPARYVEGYYLQNIDKNEVVNIYDIDAHAWVEIYIEGLGFVPVEVTPGFYKEEDEAGGSNSSEDNEYQSSGGGGGGGGSKNDNKKEKKYNIIQAVIIVAAILAVALVILIIVFIIRRKIIVARRKKDLDSDDNYRVVAQASLIIDILCKLTETNISEQISPEMKTILEKTKFSDAAPSEIETAAIITCMKKVSAKLYKKMSIIKKLKAKYIKALP